MNLRLRSATSREKGVVFQGRLDTTDDDNVISQAALERLSLQSSVAPDSNHSGSIGEVTLYFELKGAKNGTSSYHESFHVVKEKKRLAPIRTKKQSPDEKHEQEERDRVANAQQKTDEAAEKKKRREDRDKHRQSSKKSGGKSSKGSG
ncbi:hypothetical protein PG995_010537 [Apiospora arundinis]